MNAKTITPETSEAPAPKRRGRPVGASGPYLPPDQATKPRSVRLNDARWAKLQSLGRGWLERTIDRASPRPPKTTKPVKD